MKKSVSILLAFVLVSIMSSLAFAAEISPYYVAINYITPRLSMSGDTATCTASVSHSGAKANVQIILQRSTDGGKSYSDYATLVDKTYTTKSILDSGSKSGLSTSATYRTKVVVIVYDASGSQIDSGTAYS